MSSYTRMLTIKQPVSYGYRSVHDLPTPPSTSRTSPPLGYQDQGQKPLPAVPHGSSPPSQPMSAPHRSLPPPAAMTLAQPAHASSIPPPPPLSQPPGPLGPGLGAPGPQPMGALGPLPAPPPQWQGAEDSMRTWLLTKAEEEKRRQEEERTRQETLRLEQRRMEFDILRASLEGGIPPPMIGLVFAGMGGANLPPQAVEWAQQFMFPQAQQGQPPALPPAGHISPHRRDSQAQGYPYTMSSGGVPSTPGSAQGPPGYGQAYPGSPTRPRGQSIGSSIPRPAGPGHNLPTINTNVTPGGGVAGPMSSQHPGLVSSQQQQQQDTQPSPNIYFHHWQPPSNQGGREQPAMSSGDSPRKRKAVGPQQAAPPPSSEFRRRTPPFSQSMSATHHPTSRRRGHARQRSDLGSYHPSGRGRLDSYAPIRGSSPIQAGGAVATASREGSSTGEGILVHNQGISRSAAHTVSSLLSDRSASPGPSHYPPPSAEMRPQLNESVGGTSRGQSEGISHTTKHERHDD